MAHSVVERSDLTVKPGTEEAFLAAVVEHGLPMLKGVEGVRSVQVGQGVEHPDKFMLLVTWESLDAHAAYGGTPTSIDFRKLIGPFVAGGAMEHFEVQ